MSELDKGLVTTVITFICLIVFGFITGESIGRNEVIGFAGALAGLIVWYFNEKHTSDLISCNEKADAEETIETEEDIINPDYYEEEIEI